MKSKKIAVLATGANGSVIAADLINAGLDVTMIDMWAKHIEAIRASGLTITTKEGANTVQAKAYHLSDVCTFTEKFDIVLLASKAYDARWLTEFIKPYLADDGLLVAVQNGMTAEMIADVVGVERTLGCVIEMASHMFEPGEVMRSTAKEKTWFSVGAFDPVQHGRVEEVAEILRSCGRVEISDDIKSAKWMKLIVNAMAMGAVSVIGGTPALSDNGKEYQERALQWIYRLGEEALAAGQSLGYKVVPIFGLEREDVENTNDLLEILLEKIRGDVGPTAINTILQDYMKGRKSEVEILNGMVAQECKRIGRPSPVSEQLLELDRKIHRGELEPCKSNLDLIS